MYNARYFNESEFQACTPSCKRSQINDASLARLDLCRSIAKTPFILSSAYRSREYEISKGRSGTGAHTEGRAFDIRCADSSKRMLIVRAALEVGFTRIGIGKTFIHLDDSPNLAQNVIWLYQLRLMVRSIICFDMSTGVFDKILKIINIIVTILQVALKALTGLDTQVNEDGEV